MSGLSVQAVGSLMSEAASPGFAGGAGSLMTSLVRYEAEETLMGWMGMITAGHESYLSFSIPRLDRSDFPLLSRHG
jgi:hypothetical protein